jgi:hypothetical protein
LCIAALKGNTNIVEILLYHEAKVNEKTVREYFDLDDQKNQQRVLIIRVEKKSQEKHKSLFVLTFHLE